MPPGNSINSETLTQLQSKAQNYAGMSPEEREVYLRPVMGLIEQLEFMRRYASHFVQHQTHQLSFVRAQMLVICTFSALHSIA